ncbi:MAG TPA: heavy-metal-associated domain-containing protein [Clostridia bacterium]|nr:heavy-metal-associated domain-containing protein [Clostridia bacterium]
MKKTIRLENLDCAACAAKIEHAVSKLDGVSSVKVNFMGQKMVLEAAEERFAEVLESAKRAAMRVEPDLEFPA